MPACMPVYFCCAGENTIYHMVIARRLKETTDKNSLEERVQKAATKQKCRLTSKGYCYLTICPSGVSDTRNLEIFASINNKCQISVLPRKNTGQIRICMLKPVVMPEQLRTGKKQNNKLMSAIGGKREQMSFKFPPF